MFGADKQAHTDAKVGPKNDRRHHQGVPVCAQKSFGTSKERGKHPWRQLHHQAASPSGYQVLTEKNTLLHWSGNSAFHGD